MVQLFPLFQLRWLCYICIIHRKVRFCVGFWTIYLSTSHIIGVSNLEILCCHRTTGVFPIYGLDCCRGFSSRSSNCLIQFIKHKCPLAATVQKCICLNFIDGVLPFDSDRYYAHADNIRISIY